jgi:hypothetical protein
VAIACFLSHVFLLFAAFGNGRFYAARYFYSHLTLWITGILLFLLVYLFQGKGVSNFLDYFDTPLKKAMILIVPLVLSVLVHSIVWLFVLPSRRSSKN